MSVIGNLRKDQLHELKQVFELFDHDGDGLLEAEELNAIFQCFGMQRPPQAFPFSVQAR